MLVTIRTYGSAGALRRKRGGGNGDGQEVRAGGSVLIIVGALNWAVVSLFDTNVITEVFGTGTVTDVIYVLFGVSALVWVPRLMESSISVAGPHPRRLTPV